jgi:phosphate-selective porin
MHFNKLVLATALAAGMATSAQAANWLTLQGTEPAGSSDRFKLWGFIQPQYTYTENTKLKAGPWNGQKAVFNQTAPERDSSNTFQLRRARLGVRGSNFPLDSRTNYFFLVEAGKNGITEFDSSVAMTDASITLNHIPHARVRVGQFKYPGSEEGLQAIHVFDYVNFTNVTDQMMLERFLDEDGTRPGDANGPNGSVGAFRDIGIQVFDWFNWGGWEHSYAAMIGNGNGLNRTDNNNEKDLYAYWSSEKVFAGKGARREGWKMYAWGQHGERTLEYTFGNEGDRDFDRDRWGLGTTFRKGKYRAAAEYIWADGMIFDGSDGGAVPGELNNAGTATASLNIQPNGESQGYYIHLGYAITPKIELDARYDYLDRMENVDAREREFTTVTLGAQYFFNKKTRALVNYEFRDLDAPDFNSSAPPNEIADTMDDRITVQLLAIF